uniref:Zinc finger, CCHC-type n=1 Tax=Lactuca sativa TaxID=4236 RepID=A0A9R1XLQ7_LACSA|nr:hypothetical protein LSAT_V11C400185310 [Lactuca sativa]
MDKTHHKSHGSSLNEEVTVRKFLNSIPKKYLPIVAFIEQYSDLESMPLEEVVGRLKAYEDRLKIHDEKKKSEINSIWQVKKGMVKVVDTEEEMEVTMKEVEEAEEEEEVEGTKVEFGAMVVEILGTLAMNAQSGKTKTMKKLGPRGRASFAIMGQDHQD